MNILAINYEYPPLGGGGGVVFEQIMQELAVDHDVVVITSAFGDLPRLESRGRLEIHRIPVLMRTALSTATMPSMLSFWPASLRYGKRLLRQRRFDVINSHFVVPSSPSADQLARRAGLPHVLSIHGGDIYDPSKSLSPHRLPLVRGLVRKLLGRADRVVAQSQNTRDNARRYYGVKKPIDIIPLGIEPKRIERPDRRTLGLDPDRLYLVTVGRLVSRKNLGDLIHAVAELDDPRVELLVIGDGPQREPWAALAAELGVAERVQFLGFVPAERKVQLLAASDLFVSTSLHEGFGLVFLEAMDQGLPVVAYDHGGQKDFLTDGVTGGLIALGDRPAFVGALRGLIDDQARRESCRSHNLEAVKHYYIGHCARAYAGLFAELIDAASSAAPEPKAVFS